MKTKCQFCKKSTAVKQDYRKNKSGKKQKYQCLDCRKWFIEDDGFKRMRHKPKDIALVVSLRNDGLSLLRTQDHIWQHDGVKVTRRTISQWTKKYSSFLKSDKKESKTKTQGKTTWR